MREHRFLAIAGLAVWALAIGATPARAQEVADRPIPSALSPAPVGYLRPGDIVRIHLWQEPGLSGDYPVDEAGLVSLPLVGVRQATRMPAEELKRELIEEYGRQLRNQPAQITLLQRVRILGAVQNPGLYHVDATMALGDAIALAGGVRADGDENQVLVTRGGRTHRASLERGTAMTLESGDEILVPRRSWISRNATWLLGVAISATTLILTRR